MSGRMDSLQIRKLSQRCRIRGHDSEAARARLDRALHGMLEGGLDAALTDLLLQPSEHLCVRRVRAAVRLRTQRSDTAVAMDWSFALAQAIRLAVDGSGPDVVRYRSKRHALMDLAFGAAKGELTRAWAWRQLGFGSEAELSTPVQATHALKRALLEDGAAVVPVLVALERAGCLAGLIARLNQADLGTLAHAAVEAHGGSAELLAGDPVSSPGGAANALTAAPAPAIQRRVLRALAVSPLLAVARATRTADLSTTTRPLAALVLLAGEPSALRGAVEHTREVLDTAVRGLALLVHAGPDAVPERVASQARPAGVQRAGDSRSAPDARTAARAPGAPTVAPEPERGDRAQAPAPSRRDLTQTRRERDGLDADSPPDAPDDGGRPAIRSHGQTSWGGLLFLLWLVEPCGIPPAVSSTHALAVRGLRWTLHRLALELLPMAAEDAAALAFCGLAPDAEPPSRRDDLLPEEERTHIGALAEKMVHALGARLALETLPRADLLERVCARNAEIVADPGWIEVRLSLQNVSLAVRRSGLDRDPDWLPWLGAVMRFVYE
jgi:hypothetical protein